MEIIYEDSNFISFITSTGRMQYDDKREETDQSKQKENLVSGSKTGLDIISKNK